ncbi:hypothetical protein E3G44_000407 [Mycobacteroides abscessus]|nr:hypothetical protein [Mycobacteroides abscessus]SHO94242.1 Uncharacterised protein [Mycobacteroides abscessus subsp. abscessus]SHP88317.1 Uncharacterised protein [Mycobacteroides abscessus subsp. abscessus]SHP91568.1 Uncharacterised protein [Mycobacteroides abscessus subsp. abscessus]SHQ16128.1 Uncharacterised protein [Mycobacteroides abscessus subsp. abscessus]
MQTPLDFWRGCQPLDSRSMTIPTPAQYVYVVSPEWTVPYTATVGDSGLHYQAVHDDVDIISRGGKLTRRLANSNWKGHSVRLSGLNLVGGSHLPTAKLNDALWRQNPSI